jgi:hypothetical protein
MNQPSSYSVAEAESQLSNLIDRALGGESIVIADVCMFARDEGGRQATAFPGWGCPCMISQMEPLVGYDGWPQLGDTPLEPGDQRRLGFAFTSDESAEVVKRVGRFFLWEEGGFIAEACVVG